ncbi:MAG: A/G-specific adenine glycosylase [Acidobacteriota bacterium]
MDGRATLLLRWYRRHRRDLPWRRTRDPYAIWISEIMLQQTQVAKVVPYFERFMERFPTVDALAAAPIDDVLAVWTGLGYYRRARFLHRAATVLLDEGRGMPKSAEELQKLPGIGAYTAAAVASIAFGESVPVMDGNVERVICRLLALAEDPKRSVIRRQLVAEAAKLLDDGAPGDSNQALMELGATICRPRSPKCLLCPLSEACLGRQEPENYPRPKKKRAIEEVKLDIALVRRPGTNGTSTLFFRRPENAELMAGLWELPTVEAMPGRSPASVLGRRYGGEWRLGEEVARVAHGITYRSIIAVVYAAEVEARGGVASGPEAAWVDRGTIDQYAMSSLVAKVLSAVPDGNDPGEGGSAEDSPEVPVNG